MTNDVTLRGVEEGDLPYFFEHQQDPISNQMAGVPPREADAFEIHWKNLLANKDIINRTIMAGVNVVGHVLCFERAGRKFVGYWIAQEFWGRGIASRALAQFLELVVARPLYATASKSNAASIRVLEKSGFEACHETHSDSDSSKSGSGVRLFVCS